MLRPAIERILKSDNPINSSFWEYFLQGLSQLYAAAVKVRMAGYRRGIFSTRKVSCKVISIGNITVGGTGKTPFTVYVAELIHRWGMRAAVVSRGYKGEAEQKGAVVGDGSRLLLPPRTAGDEPFLLASRLNKISVPMLVGQDRIRMARLAVQEFAPDVIILDDGFQHVRLARDIDVVLLDGLRPFGNGHLLPRGVLREPLSSLLRADIFVLTRTDPKAPPVSSDLADASRFGLPDRPVFRSAHRPVLRNWIRPGEQMQIKQLTASGSHDLKRIAGRRVFAFSGLAGNDGFRQTLTGLNIALCGFIGYADHHAYTVDDRDHILDSANAVGADCLCTTDKDAVKLSQLPAWPLDLAVMGVDVDLGDDAVPLEKELRSRLAEAG